MKKLSVFVCLLLGFTSLSLAAVPVEDIQQRTPSQSQPSPQQSADRTVFDRTDRVVSGSEAPDYGRLPEPAEPVATDSYSQLQLLQEEVMQLRGLVEQLSNEVRQLKQRQMDDYMDLDRRLSKGLATAQPPANGAASPSATASPAAAGSSSNGSAEVQSYSSAYNLLKSGKIDAAVSAFKQHIKAYPSGTYTANCHYWLGEVYLLKNNLEAARQAFTTVVDSYPGHRKIADATFKLGKVYHLLGKPAKAKPLLQKVADGASTTAPLARQYLSDNF